MKKLIASVSVLLLLITAANAQFIMNVNTNDGNKTLFKVSDVNSVTWDSFDHGLSMNWATNNTGASNSEEYGNAQFIMNVNTNDGKKALFKVSDITSVTWDSDDGPQPQYEYVDLGLSVKWATCNIGASKPEEYGYYFAWGETKPKLDYSWATYKYCKGTSNNMTKYCNESFCGYEGYTDGLTVLEPEDDAAYVNWGGSWRMPTQYEFNELLSPKNCSWTRITRNGVYGYKVTSKVPGYEGNFIFLPAARRRYDTSLDNAGDYGYYWSSSCSNTSFTYSLKFSPDLYELSKITERYAGCSVRPVCPSEGYVCVTGIDLFESSLTLNVGESAGLTATVSPSNASSKVVIWTSNNEDVATVDDSGTVTAVGVGMTVIIVSSVNGEFFKACLVTVPPSHPTYEYVDLGLSVNWATFNVGASKPEEFGYYFAWGETRPKTNYDLSTYKYCKGSYDTMTKYCDDSEYGYNGFTDNKFVLEPEDDAAHVNWGGYWRMPTSDEFKELIDSCIWTWSTVDGKSGYNVVSKSNGNSIFLPAAAWYSEIFFWKDFASIWGWYWTSSLKFTTSASYSFFGQGFYDRLVSATPSFGLTVRPVHPIPVTGIDLDKSTLSLVVGDSAQLTATVSPSKAADKSVSWKSDNPSVATVDANGIVTAVKKGSATITATTSNGGYTATCSVTVLNLHASHEYVDLGLSVKWATCNIGASKSEEYGYYFAWGETKPKLDYSWSTYKYCKGSDSTMTKYCNNSKYGFEGYTDNLTVLEPEDDAAHVNWGGEWHMPTDAEFEELQNTDNCTWTWYSDGNSEFNGVAGYKVTSKKSGYAGNWIFLPAAGYRYNTSLYGAGSRGDYWSSSFRTDRPNRAWSLYFISGYRSTSYDYRFYGQSVRPVIPTHVTDIELDKSTLSLNVGASAILTATVIPSKAEDKSVNWNSDNPSVATVDVNGVVTAVSDGTATVTATTADGGYTATCSVTVTSNPFTYEYVDLGLSVKWATCNIGASKPEEYGYYFAWGETKPKLDYSWATYKYSKGSYDTMTKYCDYSKYGFEGYTDNLTVLEPEDDAAHVNWGGYWRMPTSDEFKELIDNCIWTWYSDGNSEFNGVAGYKVTSKKSGYAGNWIFLPAAGIRSNTNLDLAGGGYYWSGSLNMRNQFTYNAWRLRFGSGDHTTGLYDRSCGQSVRPVIPTYVTDIELDKSTLSLIVGASAILTATVIPSNATDKSVIWRSHNSSVATVDANGIVTAVRPGITTITVTTSDGGYTATCSVTVTSNPFTYEYVDLGLSVKWATCNIGASKPEEYGYYFAWGETKPKLDYWSTYKYCKGSSRTLTKYCYDSEYGFEGYTDSLTVLEPEDDAAHVNWGGEWRIPTYAEFEELQNTDNCTWTWYSDGNSEFNGVAGYKVTSKKSGYAGKWIFLPAAGYRVNTNLGGAGSYGYYWSSSLGTDYPFYAWCLNFYSGLPQCSNYRSRDYGLSVRPVCQ